MVCFNLLLVLTAARYYGNLLLLFCLLPECLQTRSVLSRAITSYPQVPGGAQLTVVTQGVQDFHKCMFYWQSFCVPKVAFYRSSVTIVQMNKLEWLRVADRTGSTE